MLRVDPALFANVILAVQRTGRLTGGAVRGLPGGTVLDGLQGVGSYASDVTEAQKEFELGRIRTSLERIKQIETQFNGIAGRWQSTAGSIISSARQGRDQLPMQKLNEVKNAQSKMQQMTGPAVKSFRDLVTALEHAVSTEGQIDENQEAKSDKPGDHEKTEATTKSDSKSKPARNNKVDTVSDKTGLEASANAPKPAEKSADDIPSLRLIQALAIDHELGPQLKLQKGNDKKTRIVPQLQIGQLYYLGGSQPASVIRVYEIQTNSVAAVDVKTSQRLTIDARGLVKSVKQGVWLLLPAR